MSPLPGITASNNAGRRAIQAESFPEDLDTGAKNREQGPDVFWTPSPCFVKLS
jgi:hypothetical protein